MLRRRRWVFRCRGSEIGGLRGSGDQVERQSEASERMARTRSRSWSVRAPMRQNWSQLRERSQWLRE